MSVNARLQIVPTVLILAVVGALPTSVDFAQTAPSPTETPSADPVTAEETTQEPTSLALSEFADKVEIARVRIREIRALAVPDEEINRIQAELPETIAVLDLVYESAWLFDRFSQTQLMDVRARCQRRQSQLENWNQLLRERSKVLEDWTAEFADMRGLAQTAQAEEFPETLQDRIRAVNASVDELSDSISERIEVVLTLQDRVSGQLLRITESLEQIDAAEKATRDRLLRLDSLPLWEALFAPRDEGSLADQIAKSWSEDAARIKRFSEDYQSSIRFHVGLFVVLTLLLLVLARRSGLTGEEKDADLKATGHILRRPVAAALLICMTLTHWIYPDAPRVVNELNLMFITLPLLRLLPGLVYSRMRGPLYGLAGLFVIDQLVDLAIDGTLLERLLLLLVTTLALVGTVWVVRPGGRALTFESGRWWRLAITLCRAAMLALVTSFIVNIAGNVSLAKLLTNGTLNSAYVAVILFAGVLVLRGIGIAALRTPTARKSRAVRSHTEAIRRRVRRGIHLVAFLVWGWATLSLFNLFGLLRDGIVAALQKQWAFGSMSVSLGGVLAFVLTLYVSVLLSRFIRFVLNEDVLPHLDLPRGVSATVSMLVNYFILALGFFVAVSAAGLELSQFALIAGALGVGIGFGLQSIVNNFVSGLVLIFERPIQVGDTVQLAELRGQVRRIGIRASIVRTFEGAEVIVPNGNLISSEVINWTLSDRTRRAEVFVGVKYGTDPERVLEILVQTARKHEEVLEFPEPKALFRGFGESSLDFSLRFWTAGAENWLVVSSDVTVAINAALKEAGIEIPFPQRDLHVRSVAPEARGVVTAAGSVEVVTQDERADSHGPGESAEPPDRVDD
jgi:small-conductance mechanosensitive channel